MLWESPTLSLRPTHVHRAIVADVTAPGRQDANHGRDAGIGPSRRIRECEDDIVRVANRGRRPQRGNKRHERRQVHTEHGAFKLW